MQVANHFIGFRRWSCKVVSIEAFDEEKHASLSPVVEDRLKRTAEAAAVDPALSESSVDSVIPLSLEPARSMSPIPKASVLPNYTKPTRLRASSPISCAAALPKFNANIFVCYVHFTAFDSEIDFYSVGIGLSGRCIRLLRP